jgi:hypothetical protein
VHHHFVPPDRHIPVVAHLINELALPDRLQRSRRPEASPCRGSDQQRPSQLGVLILQLLQPPRLGRQQTVKLLLPIEIGRLADARLAATSATGIPSAPCPRISAFWASEISRPASLSAPPSRESQRKTLAKNDPVLRSLSKRA